MRGRVSRLPRRVPFTLTTLAVIVAVGLSTGSFWNAAADQRWFSSVAFGLPSVADGRWWTLLTGPFFALDPWFYLPMAGSFAVLVGIAEWRLGTRKAAVITVGGHVLAVGLGVLLLWILRDSGWTWAAHTATKLDVGFSAGALSAIGVTSAALSTNWRRLVRGSMIGYVLLSFACIGSLADLFHLMAIVISLPLGALLARRRRPTPPARSRVPTS